MSGSGYERDLVNLALDNDFWARRAGASGGGTTTESYDVIIAKDGDVYVIELKTSSQDHNIYLEAREAEELKYVADQLGATAMICARWKQDTTFYGYKLTTPYRTDSGNLRLKPEDRDDCDFLLR